MRLKMKSWLVLFALMSGGAALAFCGFYVAQADVELFNESSQVILARDGNRTVLSMSNDYRGEASELALVVPIPYVFRQDQIQVGDPAIFERLSAYSAPRLVEYFDDDPCREDFFREGVLMDAAAATTTQSAAARDQALGVTVEAQFTVGEYDIVILGAEESAGLTTWLLENGYNLPAGARAALAPYLAQGMKFFVARVNLEAFAASGFEQLRPLVMAFESEDFMLPIQLGMVNAAGPQDLVVYLLSPQGRVELANYETQPIPADVYLPEFVEHEFGEVYKALFQTSYERAGKDAAFLEYAWDMAWCDPCAADPLSPDELRRSGAFWLDAAADFQTPNVYLTRLHVRYTPEEFPEDLTFRATDNRENFQVRYILQRPFGGELRCERAETYVAQVKARRVREARTLSNLTGWSLTDVRAKMGEYAPTVDVPDWWEKVFRSFGKP
ncbi:DUF2330 domain-containing protein [soil metagenome]